MTKAKGDMTKKNPLGLVVKSKDEAFWLTCIKNLKAEVENGEKGLRYSVACLEMAEEKLRFAENKAK